MHRLPVLVCPKLPGLVGSVGFGVAWVGRVPGRLRADVVDVLLFGFWWASGFKGGAADCVLLRVVGETS